MTFRHITPQDDPVIARLIRETLESVHLNIPGTAYFDEGLDHLSRYYDRSGRAYYVLTDGDAVIGGVGFAEFEEREHCCELQKLYLSPAYKGRGLGYEMMQYLEERAKEAGYSRIYLETHTSLKAAIHLYERCGYQRIDRPRSIVHSTMNRFYRKELKS